MDRLTIRTSEIHVAYTQGKYKDTIPAEMTTDDIRKVLKKLAHYEDLEEQGLLMKLKHKIGDIVYYISTFDYVIEARRISMITQKSDKSMKYRLYSEFGAYEVTEKELEKEYYSTKAEAEKALAEMEK